MAKQAALEHEKPSLRDEMEAGDVIDADYEIDDTIDEVAAKVGEGGAQYVVRVWRINPGEAEREALCAITPGEFSMEYVRQHYGPGTYDIWLYRGRAVNRRWTGRKIGVPLNWEPPKKPSEIAADSRQDETHLILQGIKELGTLIFKAQEGARAANPPPPPVPVLDPLTMQNAMLESMVRMRALFAPAQAPANDSSRLAFDAFVEGVKIMKDVGGGGNGAEKGIWDVLQTMAQPDGLLGRLTDMAQAADNRLTAPPQLVGPDGNPIPNVSGPPGAAAAPEAAPAPDLQQMQFILKMHLADLVASAKRGADPGLYAEVVIDKAGAERAQEFVNGPEAIDKLIAINPEVANHVEWFRAVGIHINDMLTEAAPGDGGTDEPTTQGDDVAPEQNPDGDAARDT